MTTKKKVTTKVVATCPMCGMDFPSRDAANEPVYMCTECGSEGFDCCVAGHNSTCPDCENEDDD